MKNRLINIEPKFLEISQFRLITGIIIGLFYSIAIYSVLTVLREVFRTISVTENYDLWIFTENEVNFYNLFFAYVSVIIAQSACFIFWFDRPRKLLGKRNYRKITIVNDQRVLNWYFLLWFSELAFIFYIMFGLQYNSSYYVFSFYPDYNYLFILIVIVLFFQTWNTIRLSFKRNSLKWMLVTFMIISMIAFSLSRINLIDYKLINQHFIEKTIQHNYQLELSESDCYKRDYQRTLIENIYVVTSKDINRIDPIIVVDNQERELDEMYDIILDKRSSRREIDDFKMVYQLHIDKSIKMDFVNLLKYELMNSGVNRIAYAVIPTNPEFDIRYYKDYSILTKLQNWNPDFHDPNDIFKDLARFQNTIMIKQDSLGIYYINNELVETNKIKQTLRDLIHENSDYMIKFHVNEKVEFSDYIILASSLTMVINELRNEYAFENYSKKYERLDAEARKEVRLKYPFHIFDLTTEFLKLLKMD